MQSPSSLLRRCASRPAHAQPLQTLQNHLRGRCTTSSHTTPRREPPFPWKTRRSQPNLEGCNSPDGAISAGSAAPSTPTLGRRRRTPGSWGPWSSGLAQLDPLPEPGKPQGRAAAPPPTAAPGLPATSRRCPPRQPLRQRLPPEMAARILHFLPAVMPTPMVRNSFSMETAHFSTARDFWPISCAARQTPSRAVRHLVITGRYRRYLPAGPLPKPVG